MIDINKKNELTICIQEKKNKKWYFVVFNIIIIKCIQKYPRKLNIEPIHNSNGCVRYCAKSSCHRIHKLIYVVC